MARVEQGTGIRISRLSVMLIAVVAIVWALCAVIIVALAISTEDPANDNIRFIQEFYNSENSEEACATYPVLVDNNGESVNSNAKSWNDICQANHRLFKSKYPSVSGVYVINSYYEQVVGEEGRIYTNKVIAVDNNGDVVEELSKIVIPYEYFRNPYYDYYKNDETVYANDEPKYIYVPQFKDIEYGIYDDGSDA